jgi:hypothetical protein
MLRHAEIEVEVLLGYSLERNKESETMIEEHMNYFARNHFSLDMTLQGLYSAGRAPRENYFILQEQSYTFNKKVKELRDDTRRNAYRINIFQVPRFKVWMNTKQKINVIGIGGESAGPDFQPVKMYADEFLETNLAVIRRGTVKVIQIGEVNGRILCVLKEEIDPFKNLFKITMLAELNVPRNEVNYLFFLHLVQKESLSNTITRYMQEDFRSNPESFVNWDTLGVYQVEGEVALTWDPPHCLKSQSSRSLFEEEKYPLFPEAEEANFWDEVT